MPVTSISHARIAPEVLTREVGDELVLMSLTTDAYYGLTGVARRAWELFAAGSNLGEAAEQIAKEYAVPVEKVLADLVALVDDLVAEGLVVVVDPDDR